MSGTELQGFLSWLQQTCLVSSSGHIRHHGTTRPRMTNHLDLQGQARNVAIGNQRKNTTLREVAPVKGVNNRNRNFLINVHDSMDNTAPACWEPLRCIDLGPFLSCYKMSNIITASNPCIQQHIDASCRWGGETRKNIKDTTRGKDLKSDDKLKQSRENNSFFFERTTKNKNNPTAFAAHRIMCVLAHHCVLPHHVCSSAERLLDLIDTNSFAMSSF